MNKRAERSQSFPAAPWHGLDCGPRYARGLNAFIEITPFDLMTYDGRQGVGIRHLAPIAAVVDGIDCTLIPAAQRHVQRYFGQLKPSSRRS
jgi:hypothetical protein